MEKKPVSDVSPWPLLKFLSPSFCFALVPYWLPSMSDYDRDIQPK